MDSAKLIEELIGMVEDADSERTPLMGVMRSNRSMASLRELAGEISERLSAPIVRSGFTPNSELSLFELRGDGLTLVLLIVKSDEENIVTVEKTSDFEIAEIESNIYSSNINDIYIRLVSDIF